MFSNFDSNPNCNSNCDSDSDSVQFCSVLRADELRLISDEEEREAEARIRGSASRLWLCSAFRDASA